MNIEMQAVAPALFFVIAKIRSLFLIPTNEDRKFGYLTFLSSLMMKDAIIKGRIRL